MPKNTPNTVTVGHVCLSCALLETRQCPYKNHERSTVSEFEGDVRGKCTYYLSVYQASGEKNMKKTASMMSEAKLNVAIYKKIYAMSDKQKNNFFKYWDYIFPSDYAYDMVTDDNESVQKSINPNYDTKPVKEKLEKQKKNKKRENKEKNDK